MSGFNQNQEHGARTGQHTGPRQQGDLAQVLGARLRQQAVDISAGKHILDPTCGDAALDLIMRYQPAPTRVEAAWPSTPADVQGACTMFAFADRIEIDLAKRCAECGTVYTTDECPDCSSDSSDLVGDEAYETWRDRQ